MMSVETRKFTRKSFDVEAVRVDESNMEGVADWCNGKVRTEKPWKAKDETETPAEKNLSDEQAEYAAAQEKKEQVAPARKFIKVQVKNPINDRQTKAFVGDWVLYTDERSGFKVYNNHAFERSFTPSYETTDAAQVRMDDVAHAREDNRSAVSGQFVSDEEAAANPETTVHEVNS